MHTGDLATIDVEGYCNIVGRIKDMVIRGDENVYPREIEEFLYRHPKIQDVQVIGVPDPRYGEELCAWVCLHDGEIATAEEIRAFCQGQIAHYKVPRYVKFVDGFPMTVTGKIQKFLMRQADDRRAGPQPAGDRVMTRIASVTTHMISVSRPQPVWTAHEHSKAWNVILTEVRTDDGLVGYGEIHGTPMPRICEWVGRFGEIIRGMDALAHIAVWEKLFALTSPRHGGIDGRDGLPPPIPRGERAPVMAAIAGIDIALWDIKGKAAGLPVYRLLGGENRPIFTYATGGYYRPEASHADYGEELARFIDLGYRAVKLKTGAGTVAEEAKRIGEVRRAIGKEPSLMLDMNAAYDLPDCIEFAGAVEPHRIFWLEEPLHWCLQPADFARLAAGTPIPLAHGERELTRFTVRDFIVEGGIRYVQFDATRAAGFTEALRIAQLAEQHGVMLAPHTAPELHGHLALASPRCVFGVESHGGPETDPLAFGLFHELPVLRDGHLHLGSQPGFGLEVDWTFVDRHRLRA